MIRNRKANLARANHIIGLGESLSEVKKKTLIAPSEDNGRLIASDRLEELVLYSGISREQAHRMVLESILASCFLIILAILIRQPLISVAAIAIPIVQWLRLNRLAILRSLNFERDYAAFLLSLASSVKAGLDPLASIIMAQELFPPESEIRKAIYNLRRDIDLGLTEEEAFRGFGEDISHPDIGLFSSAIILSRKQGSSLSECLARLARVTRNRQSFRRKMRAAVAMQRLSAIGIAAVAVVVTIIQAAGNPQSLKAALDSDFGFKSLAVGAFLMAAGLAWMMRMARNKV